MNPQMRLLIMLGVLGASGSILFAAEPASPPATQTQDEESAAAPASAEASKSAAEDEEETPPPAPASSADKAGSPQRFTPSEQVRADFDVSFPIDI